MKIRQCFLKLQLKMSGMFFLRQTVVALSPAVFNLVWIHCVATTLTDSNCTSIWDSHTAGNLSANRQRRHHGASSLTECQRACEFDPRCVAIDWLTRQGRHQCRINTNASHQHRTEDNWSHYDLVGRCNITTGQIFHDILPL